VEKQLKVLVQAKKGQAPNPLLKKLQSIIEELEKRSHQKEQSWKAKEEKWKNDLAKLQLAYNTVLQRHAPDSGGHKGGGQAREKKISVMDETDGPFSKNSNSNSNSKPSTSVLFSVGVGIGVGVVAAWVAYRTYLDYRSKLVKK